MLSDGLIPLTEAIRFFPKRNGERPHLNTLRRWIVQGCKGKRLGAKRIGGLWYTSEAWIAAFLESGEMVVPVPPGRRQQELDAAKRRLFEKRGIYAGKRIGQVHRRGLQQARGS